MENENAVTVKSTGIRYGVILGMISIIMSIAFIIMDLAGERWVQWISYLVMIGIMVMAHNYFKKEGNGYLSYGQGLGIGTIMGLVSGALGSIVMYAYVKFIDSSVLDIIRQANIDQMEGRNMSQEQIDQAMKFSDMFLKPEVIYGIAFLASIFMCFVFSLIITIFTQKKDPSLTL